MLGIIGAMEHEIELLVNELIEKVEEKVAGFSFYLGKIAGKKVVVAKSGIGKVNAATVATILVLKYGCNALVSTGIAGGLAPLKTKDVVLGEKFVYGDVDATIFGYEFGQVPQEPAIFQCQSVLLEKAETILKDMNLNYHRGTCLTSDSFITDLKQIKYAQKEIICTEMESTAIAHVANHFMIPALVLRFISDIVGEESQVTNYLEFEREMAVKSARICLEFVSKL